MAVTQLRIDGLNALRAALKALPPQLVREAGVIVHAQAEAAVREMAGAYPVRSGALRAGLRLELHDSAVHAGAVIRNRAPHAWLFENGSEPRRWANGKSTGKMPARRPGVFIPIAMQRRRIMLGAVIDLVERTGLHVSGAAA